MGLVSEFNWFDNFEFVLIRSVFIVLAITMQVISAISTIIWKTINLTKSEKRIELYKDNWIRKQKNSFMSQSLCKLIMTIIQVWSIRVDVMKAITQKKRPIKLQVQVQAFERVGPAYLSSVLALQLLWVVLGLRCAARGDLVVPGHRTEWGSRSFAVAGPKCWNKL